MGAPPTLRLFLPCPVCGASKGEPCRRQDGSPASRSHGRRTPVAPCGTYGGYQRHLRVGERPCEQCLAANRRYMAERRVSHPEERERDIERLQARRRATRRLVARHRDEFDRLMAEEESADA